MPKFITKDEHEDFPIIAELIKEDFPITVELIKENFPITVELIKNDSGWMTVRMSHYGVFNEIVSFTPDGKLVLFCLSEDWARQAGIQIDERRRIAIK